MPGPPLAEPPTRIVVPDGTWSQARRMLQRLPALQALPRLALPGPPPGLRLRRPHRGDGMSTLEAMAGALHALGRAQDAEALLALHAVAVERVMRLKGVWGAAPEALHRAAP
jgi:DTW domain-containing protein YfiP